MKKCKNNVTKRNFFLSKLIFFKKITICIENIFETNLQKRIRNKHLNSWNKK